MIIPPVEVKVSRVVFLFEIFTQKICMWHKYEHHPIDTCYSNHVVTWIFNAWKLTNV
jgi:hypothetical protein